MTQTLFEEAIQDLRDQDLYRQLKTLEPISSTKAYWQGQEILLFCGNDYLGLSHHPRVVHAAKQALKHYGVGSGAARLISGNYDIHVKLEEKLAQVKKKPKALLYSTGYLANLGILTALAGEKDLIVLDKLSHASIIDAAKLSGATIRVFNHKNYEKCERILERAENFEKKLIVTDAVFSMDGDLADLKHLSQIKKKHDALLIVDDAHGTGVLGTNGHGACEDSQTEEGVDILMGTLSKGLGCLGGFACGSEEVIEYLVNMSRPFIFATSLPPMICAAALEGLQVLEEEPEIRHRLWRNIQKMHEALSADGWALEPISSSIIPIMIGAEKDALALSHKLLEQGLFVPAVRYPTVAKGKARLRLTVSSDHADQDIELFVSALNKAAQELEIK